MNKWLIAVWLLGSAAQAVPVYRWVDENGWVNYSDRPVPGAVLIEVSAGAPSPDAGPASPPPQTQEVDSQPLPSAVAGYETFAVLEPAARDTLWGTGGKVEVAIGLSPGLQPGHRVGLYLDGELAGPAGRAARFEIEEPIYLIELDVDALTQVIAERGPLEFTPPSRFPAAVEDLAVVVDEAVPAADVERLIARSRLVERVELFDLYRGAPIPAGKKSLAFSIDYRAPDRTLTDGDVAKARKGVSKRLERELGATIRDA